MVIPFDRIAAATSLLQDFELVSVSCYGDIFGTMIFGRPCSSEGRRTPSHCLRISVNSCEQLWQCERLAADNGMSRLAANVCPIPLTA